jgi:GNAT superfamily N-acetyltransferase
MADFKDITDRPTAFFDILPADWQEGIVPVWDHYKDKARVYVLVYGHQICAGGIVFFEQPPDMEHFSDECRYWLDKGFHYIGFIWVPENQRNKNYGSKWIRSLLAHNPGQGYWLTTEEKALSAFYTQNKFRYRKTIRHKELEEQVFEFIPVMP